jgi:cytoskeletal protein CcmA (bactofilin family)
MPWSSGRTHRRGIAFLLVTVVLLGTVPGVALAETRSGGSVVVEEGETVDGLTAYGGTVVVSGTVEGDLTAFGGTVLVTPGGEVTGSVDATAGNIRLAGSVGGDVSATGGNVYVASTGSIGGTLEAAAGTIVLAGTVDENAELTAGSITLASGATINGDVTYAIGEEGDGEFTNNGASVGGSVTRDESLSTGDGGASGFSMPDESGAIFGVYGFLVNLLVGVLLLVVLPVTSERIADRARTNPLRTGGVGLAALLGVPIALALVALSIVGIPVMLGGLLTYGLLIWIATIYGRYAIGTLLLSYTGIENRWVALLAGLLIVAGLVRIPVVGWVFELLVLLLGLGGLAGLIYRFVRRQRSSEGPGQRAGTTPG